MRASFLVGLCLLVQLNFVTAHAQELTAFPSCTLAAQTGGRAVPNGHDEPEDCIEFGAAVGELGLGWRQKLPSHVRWLSRKDAVNLCQQTETEWGQKVGPPLAAGCVFLAPEACTVITEGYIAPALLSNAIRHCAP
ncbi:MAG: hypothetical protein ACKOXU_14475 [Limnohabitans sp.]